MARLKDHSQLCVELPIMAIDANTLHISRERANGRCTRMGSSSSEAGHGERKLRKKDQCQRPSSTVVDVQSSKMRLDMMRNRHLVALEVPTNRA
jgi:hypothetical protein